MDNNYDPLQEVQISLEQFEENVSKVEERAQQLQQEHQTDLKAKFAEKVQKKAEDESEGEGQGSLDHTYHSGTPEGERKHKEKADNKEDHAQSGMFSDIDKALAKEKFLQRHEAKKEDIEPDSQ